MAVVPLGDCGSGVFTPGATTLTIPISRDIPRSDPAGGATFLIVSVLANLENVVHTIAVEDDGVEDAFYAEHIFSDGLNHYTQGPGWNSGTSDLTTSFCWWGLILNPLTTANSVTITFDGTPTDVVTVMIHAFTGVNVNTAGTNFPGVGTDASWLFNGAAVANEPCGFVASNPVGVGGGIDLRWENTTFAMSPTLLLPTASYPDWQWLTGSYAFYNLWVTSVSDLRGPWTWTSGDIDTINELDAVALPTAGGFLYQVYAEQPVVSPLLDQDLTGSFAEDPDDEGYFGLNGFGAILRPGPGPTWPGITGGFPVFNSHIRLSE